MRALPIVLGILLFGNYGASMVGFAYASDFYKGYSVDISGLTLWPTPSLRSFSFWLVNCFAVLSSVFLAKWTQFGLLSGMLVCAFCLDIQSDFIPPLITINNVFSGLDMSSQPMLPSYRAALIILASNFVLSLSLLVTFTRKWWTEFGRPSKLRLKP